MKNLIFAITIMFCLAAPTYQFAQEADNPSAKDTRTEAFENYQEKIEDIKNNPALSEEEKKVLIKQKRKELKQKVGKRKGKKEGKAKGKKKGKGQGSFLKEKHMKLRKQEKAIDDDANLSTEEKEAKKAALRAEMKEKRERVKEEEKAQREEMKRRKDAIDNDSSLSDEEKQSQKKALREEYKSKKGHRLNSPGNHSQKAKMKKKRDAIDNDTSLSDDEKQAQKKALKKEYKGTMSKKGKGGRGMSKKKRKKAKKERTEKIANDDTFDRILSEEEIEKATRRLDTEEKKLTKLLKKEKINTDEYNQRMESINKVRSQLSKN